MDPFDASQPAMRRFCDGSRTGRWRWVKAVMAGLGFEFSEPLLSGGGRPDYLGRLMRVVRVEKLPASAPSYYF